MLAADRRIAPMSPPSERSFAWKEILEAVDPFLQGVAKRMTAQTQEFEPEIAGYVEYAISAQGKQLRPILVALGGETIGPVTESHETVAAIIEMVHLATLIHDDVIDEAQLRRGRATLTAKWGNEISVLLGDCLFAHALTMAASFPTPEVCRAVAAATKTVCAGEILQTMALSRRNFEMSLPHYYKVLGMKTAELFSLSCELGGYLGNATVAQRAALHQYGMALGTAYQLYDDCLDLLGSEASAGKSLGADLAKGKLTLPILVARDRATASEREKLRNWVENWDARFLPDVLHLIAQHDGLRQCRTVIQGYLGEARQALGALPDNDGRAGLNGLTEFLAQQTEALGVV